MQTMDNSARYRRQLDIVDPQRLAELPITVIGTGAIGSFTALVLAKMGAHSLTVYDPDTVELHNIPNQFFQLDHIGQKKVEAVAGLVDAFEAVDINCHSEAFVDQPTEGVVIVAVDSIEVRRHIWRQIRFRAEVDFFIDGRMGAEVAHLFCLDPKSPADVRAYSETLHGVDEILEERCTAKATLYCAGAIASLIAGSVVRFVMGDPYKKQLVFDLKQMLLVEL